MGFGDWIFLGALLIVMILGALLGFGKVFSWFVLNKIVRIIAAIFVCYTFGGMILAIPFVNRLLIDLAANWAHIAFFNKIHLEIIIYYVALFLLTIIIILIFSRIIRGISEADYKPIKVINKVFGAIIFGVFAFATMLLVFHIITWIGGETSHNFLSALQTDAGAILRPLYENNPMTKLIEMASK